MSDNGNHPEHTDFFHQVLPNKLTVIIKNMPASPVVTARVFVKAGSIYEREFLGTGISHYFEHLAHDGTTNRSKEEIRAISEEMGNAHNAYTANNLTCYYHTTTPENLETAIDLLADSSINASFPEEEVAIQKGVILKEIDKANDEPSRNIYRLLLEALYDEHPARLPIIGYKEQFEQITREDILAYYRRMYVPENCAVVIAGRVDVQETAALVEKHFGGWEHRPAPRFSFQEEPALSEPRHAEMHMDVAHTTAQMAWRTVPLWHEDLHALDLLAHILSHGNSSRLVRKLKHKKRLVHSISAYSYTPAFEGGGFFSIGFKADPAKVEKARKAVLKELKDIRKGDLSSDELDKAKHQVVAGHLRSQQTTGSVSDSLGWNWAGTGDPQFDETYVEQIQNVTEDQIVEVVKRYLAEESLVEVHLKPLSEADDANGNGAGKGLQRLQRLQLPNGIVTLLRHNPDNPFVTIKAYFRGGSAFETPETNGVHNFMATMLRKGTKSHSAEDIDDLMDSLGARLSSGGGEEGLAVGLEVLAEDFQLGLDLMAELLTQPSFPEQEMETVRSQISAGIRQRKDDWMGEASVALRQALYDGHPYQLFPAGEVESIENITRKDLKECFKRTIVAENMALGIFGNFDHKKIEKRLKAAFKKLKGSWEAPSLPPTPAFEAPRRLEVPTQKHNLVVFKAYRGMDLSDPDRYAMDVLDAVLSGAYYPGGRLHRALRDGEIVYATHGMNRRKIQPGHYAAYALTSPDRLAEAETIFEQNFQRVCDELVPAEELERGKKMCVTTRDIYTLQTDNQQVEAALAGELFGLGHDAYLHYAERINAVTAEDVQRVAKRFFVNCQTVITMPQAQPAETA